MKKLKLAATVLASLSAITPISNAATIAAQYTFDGNAIDSSGNGYNGVIIGATSTTDRFGSPGKALSFDGIDDVVGASTPTLVLADNFTFSVWFQANAPHTIYTQKPGNGPDYYHNYVIFPKQGGTSSGIGLSAGTNGVSLMEHGNDFIGTTLVYQSNIGSGWINATVTVANNGAPLLYINGAYVATGLESGRSKVLAPLGVGVGEGVGGHDWGHFNGKIDDITVYSSTLSASEVANLYAAQSIPEPSAIVLGALSAVGLAFRRKK
jgi:hypothetical protein